MIDIFYKSYALDFELLYKSLYSIKKFVSGYGEIAIVISSYDADKFDYSHLPKRTTVHLVDEYGKGYLYQQWQKLSAHKYLKGDHIMYVDSDCIFYSPINVNDQIKDGKSTILYTDYSKVGDAICWKKPTEDLLGFSVNNEYMRRLPLIYNRETLNQLNNAFPGLETIIMQSNAFSEFNALGAYAHEKNSTLYNFINTDNWDFENPICIQFWSHDRDKPEVKEQIFNILTK